MKFSAYYFHMKTKTLADFQICISVPLTELPWKKFKWSIKVEKNIKGTSFILW